MEQNKNFWEDRYKNNTTGWNLGIISAPIKDYIDQISNKKLNILIPGAGYGHEAEYLWQNQFKNITILDFAGKPLTDIAKRVPGIPGNKLVQQNFFEHQGKYDLIIEQTFFCALLPNLRSNYVDKIQELLKPDGKLTGLLFDFEQTETGPPFSGSKKEYLSLFSKKFNIKKLERCYNSVKSRSGRELFFIFEKI